VAVITTFEVQVLVREEIDVELLHVEPVDQVRVGHELPGVVGLDLRPHVGNRPEPRRVAHPAAVAVARVEAERTERAGAGPRVCQVAEGRDEQRDLRRGWTTLPRADGERNVILVVAGAQTRRIHARLQRVRHPELEAHFPPRVIDIVVVEVDGAVLRPCPLVVHLERVPVVSGDGAHREVHCAAVQAARPCIADAVRLDVRREIPRGNRRGRRAALLDLGDRLAAQRLSVETRVVDLAVEVRVHPVGPFPGTRDQERRVVRGQLPDGCRPSRDDAGGIERERVERILMDLDSSRAGVEGHRDEVPRGGHPLRTVVHARNRGHPRPERLLTRELFGPARRVGDPQREPAFLVDEDAVAAPRPRPLRQHTLETDERIRR
jgi:hypothetical protein